MPRITIGQATAMGLAVDTSCYPPLAYKGTRFNPEQKLYCFSELEEFMLAQIEQANSMLYAKGAPLGSENYFSIRSVLANATMTAKDAK